MSHYEIVRTELAAEPRRWLITGVAGFIGSHLLQALLELGQDVVGLDDYCTGSKRNLDDVRARVGARKWGQFQFQEGTIAEIGSCREASNQCDYVLHSAGFTSVPLSIQDPIGCHGTNVTGMLNVLVAARDNRVRRVVYASSSSVYGDDPAPSKVESKIGRPLSPYGASKVMNELYARQFFDHYGLETIGLRHFNIFGPRQNPYGGYAAVIPQWIDKSVRGEECVIHGDGEATRDFCHVADAVQANILAARTQNRDAPGGVFNVALGRSTSLTDLHSMIATRVSAVTGKPAPAVRHGAPRPGDIRHSAADISLIRGTLGFEPTVSIDAGLEETVAWYAANG